MNHPGTWAVTLRQPWANAVASGLDRLDRQTWAPPEWALGAHLAIHASSLEADARGVLTLAGLIDCDTHGPRGAVVGLAQLVEVASLARANARHPAFFLWRFACPVRIEVPQACTGQEGLWRLHPNVAACVLAQVPTGSPLR